MRTHNGMRPQDVAILLKIIAKENIAWQNKDLAAELFLSPAEISMSLERSNMAGLVNEEKKNVHRQTLLEFIEYGLHVVFPVIPGGIVNGIPTALSHPFMSQHFAGELAYVWPYITGKERGQTIVPLYKEAAKAAQLDELFYKMLALLDVVRVGKVRETNFALDELKRIIK